MAKPSSSHHGSQEAEKECLHPELSPFFFFSPLFFPSRPPDYVLVPLTFRVNFSEHSLRDMPGESPRHLLVQSNWQSKLTNILLLILISVSCLNYPISSRIHGRTYEYKRSLLKVREGKYKREHGGCRLSLLAERVCFSFTGYANQVNPIQYQWVGRGMGGFPARWGWSVLYLSQMWATYI
jgi:hypothetical protein